MILFDLYFIIFCGLLWIGIYKLLTPIYFKYKDAVATKSLRELERSFDDSHYEAKI